MRLESYSGTGRLGVGATDTIGFTDGDGVHPFFTPGLDYADFNLFLLTSPQGWSGDIVPGGQDGYLNRPVVADDLMTFRGEVERNFESPLKALKVGLNYTLRDKSLDATDQFFIGIPGQNAAGTLSLPIPEDVRVGAVDLSEFGFDAIVAYNSVTLLNDGFFRLIPNVNGDVVAQQGSIDENVLTGYVQGDYKFEVGNFTLSGNVGVQAIYTDLTSRGFAVDSPGRTSVVTPVLGEDSYTNFLPIFNLVITPPNDDHKLRIGVGRELARPRPLDLRASRIFSYDPTRAANTDVNLSPWGGGGGNPELRPWSAVAFDLTYEYYFGQTGALSLQGFYKSLGTYIVNRNFLVDFTGIPVPGGGPEPALRQGFLNVPVNAEGGILGGIEVLLSLPFENISESLEGFGITAGAGWTESRIEPEGPGSAIVLPGYSRWTFNGSGYYSWAGFEIRTNYTYRSSSLQEVRGFGLGRDLIFTQPEFIIDAQVSYSFDSGALEGVTLVAQGYNLNNNPLIRSSQTDDRQVARFENFGRRIFFGASYKF